MELWLFKWGGGGVGSPSQGPVGAVFETTGRGKGRGEDACKSQGLGGYNITHASLELPGLFMSELDPQAHTITLTTFS